MIMNSGYGPAQQCCSGIQEQSHLPARRTLEMLGIRPTTFYRWYERYRAGGPEALEDQPSKPDRVWNRIPDDVRERIVAMALEIPELSPRELATRFTDTEGYFVSESSVYRLLKVHDFSRYIIAWKLCTTMRAEDVTDTLRLVRLRRTILREGRGGEDAAVECEAVRQEQ
jgi:putative transposase